MTPLGSGVLKTLSRFILALLLSAATTTLVCLSLPAVLKPMIATSVEIIKIYSGGEENINTHGAGGVGLVLMAFMLTVTFMGLSFTGLYYLLLPKWLPSLFSQAAKRSE